jgi:hypothetical protein
VASSIQRTACTCLYAYVSGQTASLIRRIVCTLLMFCYRSNDKFDPKNSLHQLTCCDVDQAASSIQRTTCIISCVYASRSNGKFAPKNSLYLPICLCFQSSDKFDPKNSLYLSICLCFRSSAKFDPKNSLCLSHISIPGQVAGSIQRAACTHPLFVLLGQVASSIQRTACTHLLSPGLSTLSMST